MVSAIERNDTPIRSKMAVYFWNYNILFLDGSIKSFEALVDVLDNYSYISGLKLNSKKCQVLRRGSMIHNEVVYLKKRKFKWSKASSLGFTFCTNSGADM